MSLPASDAVIEHVPTPSIVTVLPDTVQTPVLLLAKLTSRPELADAVRLTVPSGANVASGAIP